jgi:protein required for attachment to host cells
MSREVSPTEHLAAGFARELAARLRAARLERQFETLVLVAGPAFLGHLRAALDEHTAASVKASLDKDLGDLPAHDLIEHLKRVL